MRIAVLDDYLGIAERSAPWSSLIGTELTIFRDHLTEEGDLAERLRPFEAICVMRERTPLPASLIRRLPQLHLVVTTGMHNSSIDTEAARQAGVVVCGTDSGIEPTVELTWALILAAARHVTANDRAMRNGRWQEFLGITLRGLRLGVLGLGRNGSQVAEIGQAFGMDVVAWSQNLTAGRANAVGARLVPRDELLSTSDVISIHLRLSERTRSLVGRRELAMMRDSAILVNTSRGPIIDQEALLAALDAGRPGITALDVYDDEPLPGDHPFRASEKLILSPHVGYVTEQNMRLFYGQTVDDIAAFMVGSPVRVLNQDPGDGH